MRIMVCKRYFSPNGLNFHNRIQARGCNPLLSCDSQNGLRSCKKLRLPENFWTASVIASMNKFR
jgi:hypothetical protein